MTEEWKPIEGYEGKYEISNMGRVKSYIQDSNGKIINGCPDGKGYLYVKLYYAPQKHKMFKIHRLVGKHFIPNPNNYSQINHKDENKKNNCVDNLEWCDNQYNNSYGTRNIRAGLSNRCCPTTSKKVCSINKDGIVDYYDSIGEAERQSGVSHSNIFAVLGGRRKHAGGYKWCYCS